MRANLLAGGVLALGALAGTVLAGDGPAARKQKAVLTMSADDLSVLNDKSLNNLQRLCDRYDKKPVIIEGEAVIDEQNAAKLSRVQVKVALPNNKTVTVTVWTTENPLAYLNRSVRVQGIADVDMQNGFSIRNGELVLTIDPKDLLDLNKPMWKNLQGLHGKYDKKRVTVEGLVDDVRQIFPNIKRYSARVRVTHPKRAVPVSVWVLTAENPIAYFKKTVRFKGVANVDMKTGFSIHEGELVPVPVADLAK